MTYELLQPNDDKDWIYIRIFAEAGETVSSVLAISKSLVPHEKWYECSDHCFTLFRHPLACDVLTLAMLILKFEDAHIRPHARQVWLGYD